MNIIELKEKITVYSSRPVNQKTVINLWWIFPYNPVKHKRLQAPTQFVPGRVRHPCFFLRAAYDNSYQSILLTFHFIRIFIANRHWQVEKYYLILSDNTACKAYPLCGTGSKLAGSPISSGFLSPSASDHSSPDRDAWRVPV